MDPRRIVNYAFVASIILMFVVAVYVNNPEAFSPKALAEAFYDNKTAFVQAFLEVVNEDRAKHGLPPLAYADDSSFAQWRAQYMLEHGKASHFDEEGREPSYWYSKLGGVYSFTEGVLKMSGTRINARTGREAAETFKTSPLHWGLVLDPCATHIQIGVVRTDFPPSHIYVAMVVETRRVRWIESPRYKNGVFRAVGVAVNATEFYSASIIMHKRMEPFSDAMAVFWDSYGCVTEKGIVIARFERCGSSKLEDGEVYAFKVAKTEEGVYFEIEFSFIPPSKSFNYVLVVATKFGDRVCPILDYYLGD